MLYYSLIGKSISVRNTHFLPWEAEMNPTLIALLAGVGGLVGYALADFAATLAMKKGQGQSQIGAALWMHFFNICILSFLFFGEGERIPILSYGKVVFLICLGTINAVTYVFIFQAFREGDLGINSAIIGSYGGGATILSFLIFGDDISENKGILIGGIVLGVFLISFSFKNFQSKGFIPALMGMIGLSIFFPFWEFGVEFIGNEVFVVIVIDCITVVFLLVYSRLAIYVGQEYGEVNLMIKREHLPYIILASFASVLAMMSLSWGFSESEETSITIAVSSASPLGAVLLGRVFFGEKLTKIQLWGLCLILFAIVLLPFS